jgi:hypothetical protein
MSFGVASTFNLELESANQPMVNDERLNLGCRYTVYSEQRLGGMFLFLFRESDDISLFSVM